MHRAGLRIVLWLLNLMACSHCTGPAQGTGNDGFLYYTMYCTHYTGTGAGTANHCFLLCPSRSLSLSRSRYRALCMSHYRAGSFAALRTKIYISLVVSEFSFLQLHHDNQQCEMMNDSIDRVGCWLSFFYA